MTKHLYRQTFASALALFLIGWLMAGGGLFPALSQVNTMGVGPKRLLPAPSQSPKRRIGLPQPGCQAAECPCAGMIETGNNDEMIGSAGEISRYQL